MPEKDVSKAGSGNMKCLLKNGFLGYKRQSGRKNNWQVLGACFYVSATELMFSVPLEVVKTTQGGNALPTSLHVYVRVYVCLCVNVNIKGAVYLRKMDRNKNKCINIISF